MINTNKYLLLAGLALSTFSCDIIEDEDRKVNFELNDITRRVLIEDFTGAKCINCPKAHEFIANFQEVYGDKFVAVSLHAGTYSTALFQTEEATEYESKFHDSSMGYPAAMINRTVLDANKNFTSTSIETWGAYILNQFVKPSTVDIDFDVVYTEDNKVGVKAILKGENAADTKVQVWLTESHIIARQASGSSYINDYEHNHVFRASVNGVWGEDIDLASGQETEYESPLLPLITDEWVPANMHVVVFVYDKVTNEVLQVLQKDLIVKEEDEHN